MTANNGGTNMNNTETNCLPEYIERNGIHYVLAGDVYLPLISVSDHPQKPLDTWGRKRRSYLKEHDNGLYTEMSSLHMQQIPLPSTYVRNLPQNPIFSDIIPPHPRSYPQMTVKYR